MLNSIDFAGISGGESQDNLEVDIEKLPEEFDDILYPAEVKLDLFNMYPEDYDDKVEKAKILKVIQNG